MLPIQKMRPTHQVHQMPRVKMQLQKAKQGTTQAARPVKQQAKMQQMLQTIRIDNLNKKEQSAVFLHGQGAMEFPVFFLAIKKMMYGLILRGSG